MFLQDLAIGHQAENEFICTMTNKFSNYYSNFETNNSTDLKELKKWDVKFNMNTTSETIFTEIKHDLKSEITGNFAIELTYKGEPSGLNATIAKYFIIKSGNIFYSFQTEFLKEVIKLNKYRIYNDYEKKHTLALIPIKDIEQFSKRIKLAC